MPRSARSGEFTPKHPEKYKGATPITYRSSWELTVFNAFDRHPNVIEWASESVKIPYQNPLTGQPSLYVPDLLVKLLNKKGQMKVELIEIKPAKEALAEKAKTRYDQASVIINQAKWKAAAAWCQKNNITFRILTEQDIYVGYK